MAAIDFPASPTNGQVFAASNGVTYRYVTPPGIWTVGSVADTAFVGNTPPASPQPNQLWWHSDLGQLYIYYNDGNSSQWVPCSPALTNPISLVPKITKFPANGTFTPDPNMVHGFVVGIGGGSGGGAISTSGGVSHGLAGGGAGNKVTKYFRAGDLPATVAVTIGPGGGATAVGGDTVFGSLLVAKGGGAVGNYQPGLVVTTGNVGDVIEYGALGGMGMYGNSTSVWAWGGTGGGPGGGAGYFGASYGSGANGAPNSGGGGGGAGASNSPGAVNSGSGGSGYLYVVEYLR